jgi:hypothetical protein
MLPLRRWSPARRALNGVSGKAIANAVSGAVLAFLDRHLHHSTGDVNARLEAHPGLLTGSPSELFPYEKGRPP